MAAYKSNFNDFTDDEEIHMVPHQQLMMRFHGKKLSLQLLLFSKKLSKHK